MHKESWPLWKNITLYVAGVLAVGAVCLALRQPQMPEATGDLTGRFLSSITYQTGTATYHYREAALTNLLLLGTDQGTEEALTAQDGGQADFLLLLTADRENRTLHLTHIDRDTIAQIDTCGLFGDPAGTITTQICLSHAFGITPAQRCENAANAVSRLLGGIVIDGYLALDRRDIARLNDALGGVTVTLEDDFSAEDPSMVPGATLTLTGQQAEIFLRYRSTVADGTNQNRMARQRTYLQAAAQILKAADADLLEALMDSGVCTDLTTERLLEDWSRWKDYDRQPIRTLGGTYALDDSGFVAFYPDEDRLESFLTSLFFQ